MLDRQLETGKNEIFKTFITHERDCRELKFGKIGIKIQIKIAERRIFHILTSRDIEPEKSRCLPNIA